MKEQLLTVKQVAHYLHVNQFTIYRLIMAGKLPAYKVGEQWRFKKPMIEKWLEQNLKHRQPLTKNPKVRYRHKVVPMELKKREQVR